MNPSDGLIIYRPCSMCGVPLCPKCVSIDPNERRYHKEECRLLVEAREKPFSISSLDEARKLYCFLTPLRFLLNAKTLKTLWNLEDNLEERKGTLMFCFNQVNSAKPIKGLLGSDPGFNTEQVSQC